MLVISQLFYNSNVTIAVIDNGFTSVIYVERYIFSSEVKYQKRKINLLYVII